MLLWVEAAWSWSVSTTSRMGSQASLSLPLGCLWPWGLLRLRDWSHVLPPLKILCFLGPQVQLLSLEVGNYNPYPSSAPGCAFSICSSPNTYMNRYVEFSGIVGCWAEATLLSYGCFTGFRWKGSGKGSHTAMMLMSPWAHISCWGDYQEELWKFQTISLVDYYKIHKEWDELKTKPFSFQAEFRGKLKKPGQFRLKSLTVCKS